MPKGAPTNGASTESAQASDLAAGLRVPAYSWRVWLGWVAITVLVVVPLGVLIGIAFSGESVDVADLVAGLWVVLIPSTVGYFELVNSRMRRSLGVGSPRSPGLPLAVAGLVIGWILVLLGPLALVLAYLGWRRIRAAGTPYGAGSAAAAVAFVAGILGTVYLVLVLTGAAP